jgi:hypothetical protein
MQTTLVDQANGYQMVSMHGHDNQLEKFSLVQTTPVDKAYLVSLHGQLPHPK